MKRLTAEVLHVQPMGAEMACLALRLPEGAEMAQPGQFVHIAVPEDRAHLLRRPISIYSVQGDVLMLGIARKGEGTKRILQVKPGESLDLIYPLGKGFVKGASRRVAFVGGGIGVAPLRYAMEKYADADCKAVFGYRSKDLIYAVSACEKTGAEVVVCTDDGSAGVHGLVTGPLEDWLRGSQVDLIMACGPTPMLRAVQALALRYQVEAQLSLEEHMGCGVGACLTCNCKVKRKDGEFGYKRVCADGPVLDAKEVVFL